MTDSRTPPCPALQQLEAFLGPGPPEPSVQRHVDGCPSCRRQLEDIRKNNELLASLSSADPARSEALRSPPAPGHHPFAHAIEGYKIRREIHRGGQGIVYEAIQLTTKRKVALKVLLSGAFATTRQRLRFEREIDLVAGLQHPNIVTVYDSGETHDGRHWFAMEFIEGQPLDDYALSRRRNGETPSAHMPLGTLLQLFTRICAAVSYAHQRGVIHRDLKPGNIIVDASGEPHVLDFGLAKPVNPRITAEQPTLSVAGGFLGTLAYASPEQTLSDPNLLDVRSDVYALGVILFEMVTAQHPYPVVGQLSDVLDAIANLPARTPSSCRPMLFKIDNELDTIILKSLSKEPDRRYQSAEGLRRDLEHYMAGEPIDAKRDSSWYVLKKTLLRYKVRAAVGVAFLALLLGFSIAMSVLYNRARAEADKVTKINVFLEDTLGYVEPGPGHGEATVREMLDDSLHFIEPALGDQPEIEAAVRTIIGNGYRNLELYPDAERQLVSALETRRRLFGDQHLQVAKSFSALGLLRADQKRFAEARQLFREALSIRRNLLGENDLEVAMSLANLAQIMRAQNERDDAARLLRQALAIRRDRLGEQHADVAMAEFSLATVLTEQEALAEAELLHEAALATRRRLLSPSHPDLSRSLIAVGKLHLRLGQHDEAEQLFRECLEIRRDALPHGHWRTAEARHMLGVCLSAMGRYEEAESLLVTGYEELYTALSDGHELTRQALAALINLYDTWGRANRADEWRAKLGESDTSSARE